MKTVFGEGTWFAVPLRSSGFAVGVVARTSAGGGVVLGYFFGPVRSRVPSLDEVRGLRPEAAIRIMRVGDLGLLDGSWPVIGRDDRFQRTDWVAPAVVRRDELSEKAWIVHYSDRDANVVNAETPTDYNTQLDEDSLFGSGAAEIVLTKALSLPE